MSDRHLPEPNSVVEKFVTILGARSYQAGATSYEPARFGNLFLDMCSELICFRLVRDRGQWWVEVRASHREEWHFLQDVCVILSPLALEQIPPPEVLWPIEDQLLCLEEHVSDVERLFSLPELSATEDKLAKIELGSGPW